MGRLAGIDYGTRRIGLAVSDARQRIASPMDVLSGKGRPDRDATAVVSWASEQAIVGYVVGMPFNMDGSVGPQARLTEAFIAQLRIQAGCPVHAWDERLSSYQADELLETLPGARTRKRRGRDALAAQVILQSFLDAQRPHAESAE